MKTEKLMRTLDGLDHRERLAALIEHGRTLTPAESETLIDELSRGDTQRRRLALYLAQQRRSLAPLWRALNDPALSVRCLAARQLGRYAETIAESVIDSLDTTSLAVLLREMCRRGRAAQAESLCEALVGRERLREAAPLLSLGRPEWIATQLTRAAWPDAVWSRLAQRCPELVIARINELLSASSERPDLVWRHFGVEVWGQLAKLRPAALATLVDRHADKDTLPLPLCLALPHLARWSPVWMVQTLGQRSAWVNQYGLPAGLLRRVRRVDDAELVPLCRGLARSAPLRLAELVSHLPYPRRKSVFEAATAELETARLEWPTRLLAVLPTALRDREAARMLGLDRAQTDPSWRRELLGLRDVTVVRAELEREGRASQAADRAEAHAALIRSTRRSAAGMSETLAWLARLKNDQDPVRLSILSALAEVPAHRFVDPAALDLVIAPLFDARDTSHATRMQAAKLAQRLLCARATEPGSAMFAFALSLLERLAGQSGTPDLPRLDKNLPRGAELAIVDALLPWLKAAQQRQQEHHIFRLWAALGKRAWKVPKLTNLLDEMLWHGKKNNAAWTAQLWLEDPKTRDARVRDLVKRDRSALYLPTVFQHCHQRRQMLLVERLTEKAPRGRFHDGKVTYFPQVQSGFHRWPTHLQQLYLNLLSSAEAAPKQFTQTRASLVAQRARVPLTHSVDLATALASTDIALQEAALGALVWLDQPSPALPILLDHLDSDRARVAMYALPRLARLIPRTTMVEALQSLLERPTLKVTVHKEILRLLGQLATPLAVNLLRATWAKPLHRDVRIATLHAARSLLSQPDAWTLLGEAAVNADPDIARALVEVPPIPIAHGHRARYFAAMACVADHPSPVARAAFFAALQNGWALAAPVEATALAARVIARLDARDPWRAAVRVLLEGARSTASHEPIVDALVQFVFATERDVAPAGEHDRMAQQRLFGMADALSADRHPTNRLLLERLAALLLEQPHCWGLGARLRLAASANSAIAQVAIALLQTAPTPRLCLSVEEAGRAAANAEVRDWSVNEAMDQIVVLRAAGADARLVAVAMLAGFGPRWGWGSAWTSTLEELRNDTDLDVRSAARSVWLATT
jgi:hypothetical protein